LTKYDTVRKIDIALNARAITPRQVPGMDHHALGQVACDAFEKYRPNGLGKSPKVTTKTLTRFEALTRLAALGQEIDQCLGALRD